MRHRIAEYQILINKAKEKLDSFLTEEKPQEQGEKNDSETVGNGEKIKPDEHNKLELKITPDGAYDYTRGTPTDPKVINRRNTGNFKN